jgi:uncharacterized membrane protein
MELAIDGALGRFGYLISRIDIMHQWLAWASWGIEGLAVGIVIVSIAVGSLRWLVRLSARAPDAYPAYKALLGRSLLLALELLVAADVIRTVLLDLTVRGLEILGGLVLVRTFLSWSLIVEMEGRWPWQLAATKSNRVGGDDDWGSVLKSDGFDTSNRRSVEVPVRSASHSGDLACNP